MTFTGLFLKATCSKEIQEMLMEILITSINNDVNCNWVWNES